MTTIEVLKAAQQAVTNAKKTAEAAAEEVRKYQKNGEEAKAAKAAADTLRKEGKLEEAEAVIKAFTEKAAEVKAAAQAAREAYKAAQAAEAKAAAAVKAEAEAKAAAEHAKKAAVEDIKGLAAAAKEEQKGLNGICRAVIEAAAAGSAKQRAALFFFVGRQYTKAEDITAEAVREVKAAEVLKAFKANTEYIAAEGGAVLQMKKAEAGEVWQAVKREAFNIKVVFEGPALRHLRGQQQKKVTEGGYYLKEKGAGLVQTSEAEARRIIREAKAAQLEAQKKAEAAAALREADRQAGEALRLKKAAAGK